MRYVIIYHGMNHFKITFECCRFMHPKQKSVLTFTMDELKTDVHELKTGKCMDPLGLIREVFKHSGEGFCSY